MLDIHLHFPERHDSNIPLTSISTCTSVQCSLTGGKYKAELLLTCMGQKGGGTDTGCRFCKPAKTCISPAFCCALLVRQNHRHQLAKEKKLTYLNLIL